MRRRAYFLHRWLGLGAGALLLFIGLTGALLVWNWELERWLYEAEPSPMKPGAERPSIKDALVRLQASVPEFRVGGVEFYGNHVSECVWVYLEDEKHETAWAGLDTRTGEVIGFSGEAGRLRGLLLTLHYKFFIGTWGLVFSGLAGLALITSSLTGFYLYRGVLRGLWRAPVRLGRGWRLAVSDAHKWIGVTALALNLLLGLTGLWFVWHIAEHELFEQHEESKPAFDLTRLASIEAMAETSRRTFPSAELFGVFFPEHAGEPAVGFMIDRHGQLWEKASSVMFNAETGAVEKVNDVRQAPFAEKWDNAMHALHFGWTGATWVKVLYTFAGLAPGLLAISGVLIWRLRQARLSQPRRRTETRPHLDRI